MDRNVYDPERREHVVRVWTLERLREAFGVD